MSFKLTRTCNEKFQKFWPFRHLWGAFHLQSKASLTNIFKAKMMNIFKGNISGGLRLNKDDFDIRCEYLFDRVNGKQPRTLCRF